MAVCLVTTPRLSQLAQGKRLHPSFQGSRPSPVWRVTAAALRASPSERVCHLAMPRVPAKAWQPDRPLLARVRRAVLTTVPSLRICQLSQPKRLATLPPPNMHIPSVGGLQPTRVSSHISLLATPKSLHPEYRPDRPVLWPVMVSALRVMPSERVQTLAQPKQTMALCDKRDPYRISRAALQAVASPRIEELSIPLPRKRRQK
ncbi:testicular haploid expressed gene protein-like [Arapaima gigas]